MHRLQEFICKNGRLIMNICQLNTMLLKKMRDMTTIFDLKRRFLHGDAVKKEAVRAQYWLKCAQKENLDRSSITQQTLNQLLTVMNEEKKSALANLSHYRDDISQSDIDITSSFLLLYKKVLNRLSSKEIQKISDKFKELNDIKDTKSSIFWATSVCSTQFNFNF